MRILLAASVALAAFAVYACSSDPAAGPMETPDAAQDAPTTPDSSQVTDAGKDAPTPESCTATPSTDQPGTNCTIVSACPECAGQPGAMRYTCSSGSPRTRILAGDAGPIALAGCAKLKAADFCCAPAWVENMPEDFGDAGWYFCPPSTPRLYVGPADPAGNPTLPIPPECALSDKMPPVAGSPVAAMCCEP